MSALIALEAEVRRVILAASSLQEAFGTPVRLMGADETRAAFPFLRLDRHEIRPEAPAAGALIEHRLSVEVYSRSGGREEANRLVSLVGETLRTADISPDGLKIVLFYPVYSDVFLRSDGTTFRGLIRLRALSEVLG